MRFLGVFLCVFLLLITFGTITYITLLWNTYWTRMEKLNRENHALLSHQSSPLSDLTDHPKGIGRFVPLAVIAAAASKRDIAKKGANEENGELSYSPPPDKLFDLVKQYEKQILGQLRSTVVEMGKSIKNGDVQNVYKVNFSGPRVNGGTRTPAQLVCSAAKSIEISTFMKGDSFFRQEQLDQYLSDKELDLLNENLRFDSCGVVSSAGSLLMANLGDHIDKNDYVIRFNNAPTHGYEQHVGSKTSLRIVNSQVVGKPQFRFLDESASLRTHKLFAKSPVLVWDPSMYNASVEQWYRHPDFPFFLTFFSKRLMRPDEEAHLLKPSSLWSIWDWLQSESMWPLLPNPPSSGFLGVVLAMLHCKTVHVYEFVPSMRLTKRCHYYEEEENIGCTIGEWHPLANEKLIAISLNIGNVTQAYSDGYLTIPGIRSLNCSQT